MSISFRTDWFDLAVQGTLGVGSHFLLQGIFPTQGSNLRLQHCRQLLYQLTQQGRAKPQNVCRLMVLTQSKTTRCLELWSISSTQYKKQPWKWHLIVQELILHWKIKIRSNLEGAIDGIWEEVPEHGFSMCLSHGEVFKAKNKCLKLKNTTTFKFFFIYLLSDMHVSAFWIRWSKYWSFSFIIAPSNEHPGLICFRMDWLDLLAVQETLKSLLQHHSSKASILLRSPFFIVQLSHPYMTTGKNIALSWWTLVGKHMLSTSVITFLQRSKRLLISWLQSPSAVIWEPRN